jgi:hypothetical protein
MTHEAADKADADRVVFSTSRGKALLVVGVAALLGAGPRLVVDRRGVEDLQSGMGTILWADIRLIDVQRVGPHKFISLSLTDPQEYLLRITGVRRRLADANRGAAIGDVTLPGEGMNVPFEQVLAEIRTRHAEAATAEASAATAPPPEPPAEPDTREAAE